MEKMKQYYKVAALSMAAAFFVTTGEISAYAAGVEKTDSLKDIGETEYIDITETDGVIFLSLTDVTESQVGECELEEEPKITVTIGEDTVVLYMGVSRYEKDGAKSGLMEGAPYAVGDQILCPLEVFTEGFDLEYEMDEENERLRFYKESATDYEALGQPGESIVRMYYRIQENVVNGFNRMVEYFTGK